MRGILFIISLLIITSCSEEKIKNKENMVAEIPVIKLSNTDTILYKDYVADIQAVKNVEIRARVQGYIEKISVEEGQAVSKGQLLFQLSSKEYLNALEKAKSGVTNALAGVKIAALEVERVQGLVNKKVIAVTELELARARYQSAKAKEQEALSIQSEAQTNLSYTFITAPFNGIIDRIPYKVGSLLDAGALLTTLSDNHEMLAYFNVSENEYLHVQKTLKSTSLKQNNIADLILADGTHYPYAGKIENQAGEFNDNTGSISFRVRFPNPDAMLRHGASGKIHIITHLEDVVLLPQKSVFEIQDKTFVFVVDDSNHVKMKSFVPAGQVAACYIVRTGLQAGDRVAYEGVQTLKDGAQIKPVPVKAKAIASATSGK